MYIPPDTNSNLSCSNNGQGHSIVAVRACALYSVVCAADTAAAAAANGICDKQGVCRSALHWHPQKQWD